MSSNTPQVQIRRARLEDIGDMVRLLQDDSLGALREIVTDPLPQSYYRAFEAIDKDPHSYLAVAVSDSEVVGTFQVNYLTYLNYGGTRVCQIEAVRVEKRHRKQGIGSVMMNWVISEAKKQGCHRVQLTTNKERKDAHRFYQRLGFVPTHEGMKMLLL